MFDLLILGVIVALMLASHRLAYDLGREDGYDEAEAAAAIGARLRDMTVDTFADRVGENIIGPTYGSAAWAEEQLAQHRHLPVVLGPTQEADRDPDGKPFTRPPYENL